MSASRQDVLRVGAFERLAFRDGYAEEDVQLLAAFEVAVHRAGEEMAAAYWSETRWLDAIRAALAALLRFLQEQPALGRICVLQSARGGPQLRRRRAEMLKALAASVDRGRLETPRAENHPPVEMAEAMVMAAAGLIEGRMLAEPEPQLLELFGTLMSIIVLPYLGPAVARRELARPAPRPHTDAGNGHPIGTAASNPRRLTYRTKRVLSAIGDHPGACNREIAERAGVADQGQMSKLLCRLETRELVVKLAPGRSRGAPNAWRLTARGKRVLHGGEETAERS